MQGHCLSTINPVDNGFHNGKPVYQLGYNGYSSGGYSPNGYSSNGYSQNGHSSTGHSSNGYTPPDLGSNIPVYPIDDNPYSVPQDRLISTEGCFSCKVNKQLLYIILCFGLGWCLYVVLLSGVNKT